MASLLDMSGRGLIKEPSYIQDGLIGWFDGEWNAGIGVHNPSATTWVNLANKGNDITQIDNRFTWGDKYLLPPATEAVGSIPDFSTSKTVEAILIFSSTGFLPVVVFSSNGTHWIALRANDTVNFVHRGYYAPCPRNQLVAICGVGIDINVAKKIYINGEDEIVKEIGATGTCTPCTFNGTYNWGSGTAYFYSLRFYNRELTEDEVLYNYNIDKKRFGV